MTWTNPAEMSLSEIEAEIAKISTEVRQALATGEKLGELSSKLWRLSAERQFRQRRCG
jgi:hypothetical protein